MLKISGVNVYSSVVQATRGSRFVHLLQDVYILQNCLQTRKQEKKNRELPGSLTTAKRLVQKVTALQSDPTANKFFINCIFLHSYNLLNVF